MTAVDHRPRRVRVAGLGLLLGLALTAFAAPAGTLAAGEVRVDLQNPGCSFQFVGLADTAYTVDLVRSGVVRATATPATTGGDGSGFVFCEDWSGLPPTDIIRSLDVLTFKRSGGPNRNVTVPPFDLTFNRINDTINGKTLPLVDNRRFESGSVEFCETPLTDCTSFATRPSVSGSGTFSIGLGTRDLRGGDLVRLEGLYGGIVEFSDRFRFARPVPFAIAERGSAVVTGYAKPLSTVRISFVNADGVTIAGGAKPARADGSFSVTVKKGGAAYPLKDGLRVTTNLLGVIRGFKDLGMDLSEASVDVVSGVCYPNQPYRLVVDPPDTAVFPDAVARTGVGPDFRQVNITGAPLEPGTEVTLDCSDKDGDVFRVTDTVPAIP